MIAEVNAEALELLRDFRPDATVAASVAVPDDEAMGDGALASDGGTIGRVRSVDDVSSKSGFATSDVSRALVRRSPECLLRIEALRAGIRDGLTDPQNWAEALDLWKLHVSEVN
jgi:hypothetical protein